MSTLNTSHYFNLMRILKNRITPTGTLLAFAGSNTPQGWLVCDGSAHLISDYPCLYDVIGTTFNRGSVAEGYFMIPDLRGRTLIGASHTGTDVSSAGTNITQRDIGDISGSETHTLTIAQMPSHDHSSNSATNLGLMSSNGPNTLTGSGGLDTSVGEPNLLAGATTLDIYNTGGDQPHNNMQPYLVINYIIKY
jgi:microcystin-dependent protein